MGRAPPRPVLLRGVWGAHWGPPQPKHFSDSQLGVKAAREQLGVLGEGCSFTHFLVQNPCAKPPVLPRTPPNRHLGGGEGNTGNRSNNPPAKRGRFTPNPPQSLAGG